MMREHGHSVLKGALWKRTAALGFALNRIFWQKTQKDRAKIARLKLWLILQCESGRQESGILFPKVIRIALQIKQPHTRKSIDEFVMKMEKIFDYLG